VPFLDTRVAEYCAGLPIPMKINGMREKHVLREATKDVIIDAVYDREKHPFTSPPAKVDGDDALYGLYRDVFASKALDEQPIFDPVVVRRVLTDFANLDAQEQVLVDGLLNRVLSMTLMHERFGMSA
jgi:asparagine synthase (glutamine-hydrolysing)